VTAIQNSPTVQLTLGSMTHIGRVRSANEDSSAAMLPPNAPAGCGGLLIVCDGMGGHQAGDFASNTAVSTFVSFLRGMPADALSPARAAETLKAAAEAANVKVFGESNTIERAGMGHVGDS